MKKTIDDVSSLDQPLLVIVIVECFRKVYDVACFDKGRYRHRHPKKKAKDLS